MWRPLTPVSRPQAFSTWFVILTTLYKAFLSPGQSSSWILMSRKYIVKQKLDDEGEYCTWAFLLGVARIAYLKHKTVSLSKTTPSDSPM